MTISKIWTKRLNKLYPKIKSPACTYENVNANEFSIRRGIIWKKRNSEINISILFGISKLYKYSFYDFYEEN